MLAEEYHEENKGRELEISRLKGIPKYWESMEDLNKSLAGSASQSAYQIGNVISQERSAWLCDQIDLAQVDIFESADEEIEMQLLRKELDLLMMGIPGELFLYDE